MSVLNFSDVIIRTQEMHEAAAFLSLYGMRPNWTPPLPAATAKFLYGEFHELRQLRMNRPGASTGILLVETKQDIPKLKEFTKGGYGIDFYTTDMNASVQLTAQRTAIPAPPIAWEEAGVNIIEVRVADPTSTYAVFLPQMHPESRLHFSQIDNNAAQLHSELCMTSWIIDKSELEDERAFWRDTLEMKVVLDTDMDAEPMQVLMGHSKPAAMTSLQFAYDHSACLVDLLTYPDISIAQQEPKHGALCALALTVTPDTFRRLVPDREVTADIGSGPKRVGLVYSPSGIPVQIWSAATN